MSLNSPKAKDIDAKKLRFGLVASRFNEALVDALVARAGELLKNSKRLEIIRVPGAHEIPWGAQQLAATGKFDCVIALGVLIGGDTNHHEMVGDSVSHALQTVAINTGIPVINGVIVANTLAQAEARCTGSINRGAEFVHAALEMAVLKRSLEKKS
ncbi:6,7-dimethyl-8-ribityllumazine synthase [Oleiharenicola lentus]|uniref:6,7-dimethyl-8-ribityllumazine synthase n=1 Tax=Oleiharenicola lentus TaxID=2508720 RepID=UPI003F66BD7A